MNFIEHLDSYLIVSALMVFILSVVHTLKGELKGAPYVTDVVIALTWPLVIVYATGVVITYLLGQTILEIKSQKEGE